MLVQTRSARHFTALGRIAAALIATTFTACHGPCPTEHVPATSAIGPYSAAVAAGDLVFLAGKIGLPAVSFGEEVAHAIDAIEADLARLELTLADVVSVNVFVTDLAKFGELNDVYAARFPEPWPARTTVGVAALPKGAQVELQAVARRRQTD